MPPHWQPKDDKHDRIDDLNNFVTSMGGNAIDYDTRMTLTEINNLIYAFEQMQDRVLQTQGA
jgi:hypothetical protein